MLIPETVKLCYDAHMTTDQNSRKRRPPHQGAGGKKRAAGARDHSGPRKNERPSGPGGPKNRSSAPKKAAPAREQKRADSPEPAASFRDASQDRGERIAKVMARVGLCSRREAEKWIEAGRVQLNGKVLDTPAVTVTASDKVLVDDVPLPLRERTRLWLYHKPRGLVTTNRDPEGRPTVFDKLPDDLPRVLAVGRLDINTEGLLLLTNDGGLARVLELPSTGWLRRYRVRAFGKVTQADLDGLAEGIAIDGVLYGAIEATLDKEQGDNVWLTVGLREGKNREVKRVLEHLGLTVNRLIRLSFGPFQLQDLDEGAVREIRGRVLRDQLGEKLAEEAGADFEAPILHEPKPAAEKKPGGSQGRQRERGRQDAPKGSWMTARDGAAATSKGKKVRNSSGPGGGGDKPKRRKNAGERQEKVSPRSRFRMTSEPKPRRDNDRAEPPAGPKRKIWSEDGLVDDKQQQSRTSRPKGPPRDGGPRGGRS